MNRASIYFHQARNNNKKSKRFGRDYMYEQLQGFQFRGNGPILGLDKWHPAEAEQSKNTPS